ncbi:MAG: PCRF domain-containing protein, partial [Candidatus Nanopelagicales bacterium]
MADIDVPERISALETTMGSIEAVLDLPAMKAQLATVEAEASVPDLWDDQDHAQKVTSRLSFLQGEIRKVGALRGRLDDLPILFELAESEDDEAALADAVKELDSVETAVAELEVRTLLSGEYDAREAFVSIRSGAGGVDAADWAEMLLRMYTRYCERHDWPFEVNDTSYAEEAGIKSATFHVKAPYA